MAYKSFKPYTPGRRQMTVSTFEEITTDKPEKSLLAMFITMVVAMAPAR